MKWVSGWKRYQLGLQFVDFATLSDDAARKLTKAYNALVRKSGITIFIKPGVKDVANQRGLLRVGAGIDNYQTRRRLQDDRS
jgi:hypothetical protein